MDVTLVYHLTFMREMMEAPVLQRLCTGFDLAVTLRRAMLSEEGGWAEVALTGRMDEANRALAWLQTTGVTTTGPVEASTLVGPASGALAPVGRGT